MFFSNEKLQYVKSNALNTSVLRLENVISIFVIAVMK